MPNEREKLKELRLKCERCRRKSFEDGDPCPESEPDCNIHDEILKLESELGVE